MSWKQCLEKKRFCRRQWSYALEYVTLNGVEKSRVLILSLHKSLLGIMACSESVSIITVGSHYSSVSVVGMVLLCHNSWPKYRVLLVKGLWPHFIFHFAHCLYNRVFYEPVPQQTNNVRYFNISPYNRSLESQKWF